MTTATAPAEQTATWTTVCRVDDIIPATGVAALIKGKQIAVIRPENSSTIYALSNYDPFSKAFVLSRGIVGTHKGQLKIASPIYKQGFLLETGVCIDDPTVSVPTYQVKIDNGVISVRV
jgi:nitrite reductase (NADH) small subunit